MSEYTSKRCSKCGATKLLTEFHRENRSKDGLRSYCKSCRAAYVKDRYTPVPKRTLLQCFWLKVNKSGSLPVHCPELGPCWIWTGSTDGRGYGSIRRNGILYKAHRLSYKIANGTFDESLDVLHRCDNPSCVNPLHLWIGTAKDNVDDMVRKGRHHSTGMKGERNPNAKLTRAQADRIRERWIEGGVTQKLLAKEFGVHISVINRIVLGKSWKTD